MLSRAVNIAVGYSIVACLLLAWIIALGGLAALTKERENEGEPSQPQPDIWAFVDYGWWVLWYIFFLLVTVAVCIPFDWLRILGQLFAVLLGAAFAMLVDASHDAKIMHDFVLDIADAKFLAAQVRPWRALPCSQSDRNLLSSRRHNSLPQRFGICQGI
jgi:hypothetical protein